MSDKKIQVELTEDEACSRVDSVAEKISAALPPEYPEGIVAWVTTADGKHFKGIRGRESWYGIKDDGLSIEIYDAANGTKLGVTKVEPLRVLADYEYAYVIPDSPKMLRETLCVAQSRIGNRPYDEGRKQEHINRLQRLIDECERHRPLGIGGKHGDLHTPTCGCKR